MASPAAPLWEASRSSSPTAGAIQAAAITEGEGGRRVAGCRLRYARVDRTDRSDPSDDPLSPGPHRLVANTCSVSLVASQQPLTGPDTVAVITPLAIWPVPS